MVSIEVLVMVSVITACVGALIGALVSRSFITPENEKELEKRLHTSQEELNRYKEEVADHFSETSRLVGNLTQSYKEVHEHMSRSAIQLTDPEISKKVLEAGDRLGLERGNVIEPGPVEPPKDWAPKTPGETGTLSEEFGLRDEQEEPGIETITAAGGPIVHPPKPKPTNS